MKIPPAHKKGNPDDIYYYRPGLPLIDTSKHFEITVESGKLRVKNKNINCLFSHLTAGSFEEIYNDFNRHLNLDYEPLELGGKVYSLTEKEKQKLFDTIVTNWIYYYTINNLKVEVKRSDFTHPYMVDYVLNILDKKFGKDTGASLALGAKLLRQDPEYYIRTVQGRRMYYER
jgi:hypothetical protein